LVGFRPSGENFFQERKLGIIHNFQEEFGYRSGRTVKMFVMFWQLPRTYCLNMAALQSFSF
jgi:hypothetical protein